MKRFFVVAAMLPCMLLSCGQKELVQAPVTTQPEAVDTLVVKKDTTDFYRYLQARNGLPSFLQKLEDGGNVVIGYLGGSITEFAGYRVQTVEQLQAKYPQASIKGINAGVGGTGVPLGVFRVDGEVLAHNPDLVFVEFLVNDYKTDSLQLCLGLEGIVRKIKAKNSSTDICFLYTIDANILKDVSGGVQSRSLRIMEKMAAYYGITTIDLGINVHDSITADKLIFNAPANSVTGGKVIFSNDGTHPTVEGHKVYTNTIMRCLDSLKTMPRNTAKAMQAVLYAGNYQYAKSYQPQQLTLSEGWMRPSITALDKFKTTLPNLVYADNTTDSLVFDLKTTILGLEDIMGPTSAELSIEIDGRKIVNRRFDAASNNYRRAYLTIPYLTDTRHHIVIKLNNAPLDKFAILGTTQVTNPAQYSLNHAYVANVLALDNP